MNRIEDRNITRTQKERLIQKRRRFRYAAALLTLVTVIVIVNMVVTFVTVHQGCSPGPRPYGWSNASWNSYASTICSGVL